MLHAEDFIRWLKPNHPKWILTVILFFFNPIEGDFTRIMVFEMVDLITRFFLGQRFIFWVWVYALFISYLFSCLIYHVFVFLMKKYQKKPEHPLYEIEQ